MENRWRSCCATALATSMCGHWRLREQRCARSPTSVNVGPSLRAAFPGPRTAALSSPPSPKVTPTSFYWKAPCRNRIGTLAEMIVSSHPAEHFEECSGSLLGSACRDRSESPHQALPVHSANLIERHLSTLSLETNRYSCRVGARDRRHRGDNDGLQMMVHFIG